jgi:hypothetical protein
MKCTDQKNKPSFTAVALNLWRTSLLVVGVRSSEHAPRADAMLRLSRALRCAAAMGPRDPYTVLGVAPTATADEVKKAHRRLAKRFHPDSKAGESDEAKFIEAQSAFDAIKENGFKPFATSNPFSESRGFTTNADGSTSAPEGDYVSGGLREQIQLALAASMALFALMMLYVAQMPKVEPPPEEEGAEGGGEQQPPQPATDYRYPPPPAGSSPPPPPPPQQQQQHAAAPTTSYQPFQTAAGGYGVSGGGDGGTGASNEDYTSSSTAAVSDPLARR